MPTLVKVDTVGLARSVAAVLTHADSVGLPRPSSVSFGATGGVSLQFDILADLADWAQWMEVPVREDDGAPSGEVFYTAEGDALELPIRLLYVRAQDAPAARTQQQWNVLDFINQRPDFVTAMRNCPATARDDYARWNGHAEARRHLATHLGLTVPHERGDQAEPAVVHATGVKAR